MKRSLLALTLGLFATTAACGDASCEDAVNHAAKLLGGAGYGGRASTENLVQGFAQCKEEKWSAAARNCIVSSRNLLDLRGCKRHLEK